MPDAGLVHLIDVMDAKILLDVRVVRMITDIFLRKKITLNAANALRTVIATIMAPFVMSAKLQAYI